MQTPQDAVRGAYIYNIQGFTLADLDALVAAALENTKPDQLQGMYEHNPRFRAAVDKEVHKMMVAACHYRVKRAQERRRLKRKTRNQK